jgi:ssDNA-binding replication factor A large subunit
MSQVLTYARRPLVGFFKARIEITKPEIRVYVNDAAEPCLVVNELSDRTGGRIGLWMGNNSDGSFAELVLRPAGSP